MNPDFLNLQKPPDLTIVLHRPVYPRNVGMCARAAMNLGIKKLIVIDPRFEWDLTSNQFEARQGAAHASPLIRSALVYPSLETFKEAEGAGIRIALSGIESPARRTEQLESLLDRLKTEPDHPIWNPESSVQLHFGTEDSGLSAAEFEIMNFVAQLPSSAEVPSLNLSHAVLLASFITQRALESQVSYDRKGLSQPANNSIRAIPAGRLEHPKQAIRDWLLALGFDLETRKKSIEVSLNRVLLSHCPHPEDVRLVEKVLFQTVAKLRSNANRDSDPES